MNRQRPQLNLTGNFTRGNKNLTYWFNETSTLEKTRADILKAFLGGVTCFSFRFRYKGRLFGKADDPDDNVAIPPGANYDEEDALEMAEVAYLRFVNAIALLTAG